MKKWFKHTLAEMKIKDDLTMENVYNAINNYEKIDDYISNEKKLESNLIIQINNKYKIIITYINNISIRFRIDKENFSIFTNVIKYEMKTDDNKSINLDIVSISQLKYIIKEYAFNKALIYCPQCNNSYFPLTYEALKFHKNHSDVVITESSSLQKLLKESFDKFFKEGFDFIGKDIKPLEFEPNFKLYFKNSDLILAEGKLHIFEDKNQKRIKLVDQIDSINAAESLIHFFGQPGKGKTLTLIGILKYIIDHTNTGTFYINCKALSNLEKPTEIKQVIIDEIPFLFYQNYNDYSSCVKSIINYDYRKNSSFFELIDLVMVQITNSLNKKNEYIILLDQYNDKYDKNGINLNKLYYKLIKNKDEKIKDTTFCLLTFSSMNNNDIRQYKIQYIQKKLEKENDKGHSLCEIDNLEYDLSIDNGNIFDKHLKRLGYGLKYYNILKYYYSQKKEGYLPDFIEKTKFHIRENLLSFFKISNDLKDEAIKFQILGSFSTDVYYFKDSILSVINNIPFKYFDILRSKHIEEEYKIIFAFPLVGEVMNEIYTDIINTNPNIYINLTNIQLDGGAKGKFFEKLLTYHLNIESTNNKEKEYIEYFEDYPIKYHDEMEVLVLNKNEKPEKILIKKGLKKGVYLITQRRYNGKALDIAFINVSEINEIIGIQISINKKNIFTKEQISNFLLNLKQNVEINYDIEVKDKNLYFCYIFDWKSKNNPMIDKCKKNGIKFLFYDVMNDYFKDNGGSKIIKLKLNLLSYSEIINTTKIQIKIDNYFSRPQKIEIEKKNETSFPQNEDNKILQGPLIKFNEKQNNSIKIYFKNSLNLNYQPEIKYRFSMDCFNSKFVKDDKEFCLSKKEENNNSTDKDSIIMFTNFSISKIIGIKGTIYTYIGKYSKIYDYYEVILKTKKSHAKKNK